ncbi:MAG: cytochrome c biogenesis heme-transporting ATPase CcmA [Gammaproteobacteria bacterium]|nr:cytochrome c biogenesis heme-transporting ATPase CcmA [Gammaproteobacteria bacterium]
MSLKTRGLSCIRGHRTLFEELAFTLDSGQVLLVEGSNGSGKTTLLKMLTGLRPPDAGEIFWQDQNIDSLGAEYREQIAWLGHSNGIKEDLTAAENLRVSQTLCPGNGRKINEALERVNLRQYKNTLPRQFSAGMKRRLALARLLLVSSPLWILDEPQSALDKTGIAMFETFLSEHLDNGGMAVMTSHHDVDLHENYIIRLRLSA